MLQEEEERAGESESTPSSSGFLTEASPCEFLEDQGFGEEPEEAPVESEPPRTPLDEKISEPSEPIEETSPLADANPATATDKSACADVVDETGPMMMERPVETTDKTDGDAIEPDANRHRDHAPKQEPTARRAGGSEARDEVTPTVADELAIDTASLQAGGNEERKAEELSVTSADLDASHLQERFETIEHALTELQGSMFPRSRTPVSLEEETVSFNPEAEDLWTEMKAAARRKRPKSESLRQRQTHLSEAAIPGDAGMPLCVVPREGAIIWDADDKRYVDFSRELLPHPLGYEATTIRNAMQAFLEARPPKSLAELELELGERLRRDHSCEHLRFAPTSDKAIDWTLALCQIRTSRPAIAWLTGETPISRGPDQVFLNGDDPRLLTEIEKREHELAALVLDPLGLIKRTPDEQREILRQLRETADRCRLAIILDERLTAYRWSASDGRDLQALRPDLVWLGDNLSGGLPLGVIAGSGDWLANAPWPRGGEESPHVLALVSALETLRSDETLKWSKTTRIAAFVASLSKTVQAKDLPMEIDGLGAFFRPRLTKAPEQGRLLECACIHVGLRMKLENINGCPECLTQADLETAAKAFEEAAEKLQEQGFLIGDPRHLRQASCRAGGPEAARTMEGILVQLRAGLASIRPEWSRNGRGRARPWSRDARRRGIREPERSPEEACGRMERLGGRSGGGCAGRRDAPLGTRGESRLSD